MLEELEIKQFSDEESTVLAHTSKELTIHQICEKSPIISNNNSFQYLINYMKVSEMLMPHHSFQRVQLMSAKLWLLQGTWLLGYRTG